MRESSAFERPPGNIYEVPTEGEFMFRARNKNTILQLMREGDMGDPFGNGMAWAFACAENLAAIGVDVPSEAGYRMSPFGAVLESYEDMRVQEYLDLVNVEVWDVDSLARISEVQEASRLLNRYLNWCELAGRSY